MRKILIALVVGGILGALQGSVYVLIPWGIMGLLMGYLCETILDAVYTGSVYGFFLAFVFMLVGYKGVASVYSRLPFFIILGLVGAICGLILALLGRLLKKRIL